MLDNEALHDIGFRTLKWEIPILWIITGADRLQEGE